MEDEDDASGSTASLILPSIEGFDNVKDKLRLAKLWGEGLNVSATGEGGGTQFTLTRISGSGEK